MFSIELVNRVSKVEKETGVKLPELLGKVPLQNVLTAVNLVPINKLVDIVRSVPLTKLVEGLTIITPKEIQEVNIEKLHTVLVNGNMETVRKLTETFTERDIIITLNKLEKEQIRSLLQEDNLEVIKGVINNLAYVN